MAALVSTQVFVPEARRKLAGGGAAARTPGGWQNVPLALKGRQTRHRLTPFQGWGLNGNGSGGCACAPPPANLPCPSGTKTSFPTCVETNARQVALLPSLEAVIFRMNERQQGKDDGGFFSQNRGDNLFNRCGCKGGLRVYTLPPRLQDG